MNLEQRQVARAQAADMTRTRGTRQKPQPPRDLIAQAAPRGIFLTWNLPAGFTADIQRWRIYKGDENTLFAEIADRGTRQCFVETSAGATPPATNLFVSSVNQFGIESQKVQIQAKAATEAGAPTMPSAPPGFTDTSSGGGDRTTGSTRLLIL